MGNDLHRFPENPREKCGFGAGVVYGPGSAAYACGQANIALRADTVAQQECRVSRRRRDGGGWARY